MCMFEMLLTECNFEPKKLKSLFCYLFRSQGLNDVIYKNLHAYLKRMI